MIYMPKHTHKSLINILGILNIKVKLTVIFLNAFAYFNKAAGKELSFDK